MSREWRLYLEDIVESISRIRLYTADTDRQGIETDLRTLDAVLRNLEILGEAAKHLPNQVREQMPNIEWPKICGMRDWLAHVYFQVNIDIVWDVLQNKLPELERSVQEFLQHGIE
jgi:uncharacterized protein with HEPN domain